jgi:hypothetical protein
VLDLLTSALVRLAAHVNAVQLLKTSVEVRGGGRAQLARGQLKDTKATAWCSVGDELASISGVRRVQEGVLGFQIVACNCTEYPTSFCKHNPIVGKKKVQEPRAGGCQVRPLPVRSAHDLEERRCSGKRSLWLASRDCPGTGAALAVRFQYPFRGSQVGPRGPRCWT